MATDTATKDDVRRLHQRLDDVHGMLTEIKGDVGKLSATLAAQVASCEPCRKIVMGNGGESVDKRLTKLETVREIGGKGFWAAIGLLGTALSVLATIVAVFLKPIAESLLGGKPPVP